MKKKFLTFVCLFVVSGSAHAAGTVGQFSCPDFLKNTTVEIIQESDTIRPLSDTKIKEATFIQKVPLVKLNDGLVGNPQDADPAPAKVNEYRNLFSNTIYDLFVEREKGLVFFNSFGSLPDGGTTRALDLFMIDFNRIEKGPAVIRQIFRPTVDGIFIVVTEKAVYTYDTHNGFRAAYTLDPLSNQVILVLGTRVEQPKDGTPNKLIIYSKILPQQRRRLFGLF